MNRCRLCTAHQQGRSVRTTCSISCLPATDDTQRESSFSILYTMHPAHEKEKGYEISHAVTVSTETHTGCLKYQYIYTNTELVESVRTRFVSFFLVRFGLVWNREVDRIRTHTLTSHTHTHTHGHTH